MINVIARQFAFIPLQSFAILWIVRNANTADVEFPSIETLRYRFGQFGIDLISTKLIKSIERRLNEHSFSQVRFKKIDSQVCSISEESSVRMWSPRFGHSNSFTSKNYIQILLQGEGQKVESFASRNIGRAPCRKSFDI